MEVVLSVINNQPQLAATTKEGGAVMKKNGLITVLTTLVLVAIVALVLYGSGMLKLQFPKHVTTTVAKTATPKPVAPAQAIAPAPAVAVASCQSCCCCPCPQSCPKPVVTPKKKAVPKAKVKKAAPVVRAIVQPPPVMRVAPKSAAPVATANDQMCSNGWSLTIYKWSRALLSEDLRKKVDELIAVAGNRSSHRGDSVSRTLDGQLRREGKQFQIDADIRVLYRDPKTLVLIKDLGVTSAEIFQFPDDPRQWIVELDWPQKFISPTNGQLWIFPDEWGRMCTPNVHGIVP